GKTFKKPRRPYEKERLDAEFKVVGEVQYGLSRIRNAARVLLTLDDKMNRYGLLDESQNKLDYVLALTVENFLESRLQPDLLRPEILLIFLFYFFLICKCKPGVIRIEENPYVEMLSMLPVFTGVIFVFRTTMFVLGKN
ncbi:hypothetical protein MKW94_001651, partial [Papaver nudicaule]|nr:hypothetical protein [Papaver nudicaule]